jgi:hypothetical protein
LNPGTLEFEPIPQAVPASYEGFQWSNFDVVNGIRSSVYHNGVVSPNNVVFNVGRHDAEISGGLFDLDSAYLSIPLSNFGFGVANKVSLEVQGYLNGNLIYDNTYNITSLDATLFNFDYLGVNDVKFIPSLISPIIIPPNDPFFHQPVFVMDNLTVSTPDSATTFLLLGLSCSLLAFAKSNFSKYKN